MLVQFSIRPLQGEVVDLDTAHTIHRTLEELDVHYEVGRMGTVLEGEWDQVMATILACHQAVSNAHRHVLTQITIDDQGATAVASNEAVCQSQLLYPAQSDAPSR